MDRHKGEIMHDQDVPEGSAWRTHRYVLITDARAPSIAQPPVLNLIDLFYSVMYTRSHIGTHMKRDVAHCV